MEDPKGITDYLKSADIVLKSYCRTHNYYAILAIQDCMESTILRKHRKMKSVIYD